MKRRTSTHRDHRPRFVYCLTDGEVVKIGSSVDPDARLAACRKESGLDLRIAREWRVGAAPQSFALILEGAVHQRLGRRGWAGKEWYHRDPDEVIAIADAVIASLLKTWRRTGVLRRQLRPASLVQKAS